MTLTKKQRNKKALYLVFVLCFLGLVILIRLVSMFFTDLMFWLENKLIDKKNSFKKNQD